MSLSSSTSNLASSNGSRTMSSSSSRRLTYKAQPQHSSNNNKSSSSSHSPTTSSSAGQSRMSLWEWFAPSLYNRTQIERGSSSNPLHGSPSNKTVKYEKLDLDDFAWGDDEQRLVDNLNRSSSSTSSTR